MNIDWEHKIITYVEGSISNKDRVLVEEELNKSPELNTMLKEYQLLFRDIQSNVIEQPSPNLSRSFYRHLGEQEQKHNSEAKVFRINSLMKYAAIGIVLIAATMTIWNQTIKIDSSKEYAFNEIMMELDAKSETDKIKALRVNNSGNTHQDQIVSILIESMKSDESSHVRLASVETLGEYLEDEQVRSSLIRALGIEKDPQVQVALIMTLSAVKERGALQPLENIINREEGFKFVKDEAHAGIMKITSI